MSKVRFNQAYFMALAQEFYMGRMSSATTRVKEVFGNKDPEVLLLLAVMQSAADDHDFEYFESDIFEKHCEMLGIDSDPILLYVEKAHRLGTLNNLMGDMRDELSI